MVPVLAHGGTAGLAVEISLLALPLVGFALLWWWNRRLSRRRPSGDARAEESPEREAEP